MWRVPLEQFFISKVKNNTPLRYFLLWLWQDTFTNKPYEPKMNVIENKCLTGLLMSCTELLHATV